MNHEKPVLDEIDALIAQGLDEHGVPLDDYSKDRYVKCELCQRDWHGTVNDTGCPGAYATAQQADDWRARYSKSKSVVPASIRVLSHRDGDRILAVYTDPAGHEVRGEIVYHNRAQDGDIVRHTALFIPFDEFNPGWSFNQDMARRSLTIVAQSEDSQQPGLLACIPVPDLPYRWNPVVALQDSPDTLGGDAT
jgi:hypothetical protein